MRGRLCVVLGLLFVAGVVVVVLAGSMSSAGAAADCGLPEGRPLWIEYGQGAVPTQVREVFSRPGVVLAASGTTLPAAYRARGASTVYFELTLSRSVGVPGRPADPGTVDAAAEAMFDRAVASTLCEEPWIGLNELGGPAAPTPWTPSTAQYRANVLALLTRLAEKGARPVLFVHGNPNVAAEAGAWWREVGRVAYIAYESYYDAVKLDRLGRILGPRRIRFGMRAAVRRFTRAGVPRERLGLVLGFQVAPGKMGREGLQPSANWFRVVKWNTLAAQQIARELALSTVWSWGWGTFAAASDDPDKPAAACVHLWARNTGLCDAPAAAGSQFNRSRVEGAIVIPKGVRCLSAAGRLGQASVDGLQRLTGDPRAALNAAFTRHTLRKQAPVPTGEILALEREVIDRAFAGSRDTYQAALAGRNATPAVARSVIGDELRRQRIATQLEPGQTVLEWITDLTTAEIDTTTCLRDDLPGNGDFPRSDKREIPTVPLPASLPFLFQDTTPPAPPQAPHSEPAEHGVQLDWADNTEPDLLGYHVYRADTPGSGQTLLTNTPTTRSTFLDTTPPDTATATYAIRALDTSLNQSRPTPEIATSNEHNHTTPLDSGQPYETPNKPRAIRPGRDPRPPADRGSR